MTRMRVTGTAAALEVQLTDEEARCLAHKAQQGDKQARDRLAHSLMGLALYIAGAYSRATLYWVDEVELQGEALETLLRYGIDRYNPHSNIPVRTWVALVIRRRLAGVVERTETEVTEVAHYAVEQVTAETSYTMEPDAHAELKRLLEWAQKSGTLTDVQASVLVLRGKGLLFDAIGERLSIHRKKASREYAAALVALEGHL